MSGIEHIETIKRMMIQAGLTCTPEYSTRCNVVIPDSQGTPRSLRPERGTVVCFLYPFSNRKTSYKGDVTAVVMISPAEAAASSKEQKGLVQNFRPIRRYRSYAKASAILWDRDFCGKLNESQIDHDLQDACTKQYFSSFSDSTYGTPLYLALYPGISSLGAVSMYDLDLEAVHRTMIVDILGKSQSDTCTNANMMNRSLHVKSTTLVNLAETSTSLRRFACPYFQHNPGKTPVSQVCAGPGWSHIYQVKQHLRRAHTSPIHCHRCLQIFASTHALLKHSENIIACNDSSGRAFDSPTKYHERQLRRTLVEAGAESEVMEWRALYSLLFPHAGASEPPSPFYDEPGQPPESVPHQVADTPDLEQFEAYMQRELPRQVRKALEVQIEELVGPLEETLKNKLEAIVQGCHKALTTLYLLNTKHSPSVQTSGRSSTFEDLDQSKTTDGVNSEQTNVDQMTDHPQNYYPATASTHEHPKQATSTSSEVSRRECTDQSLFTVLPEVDAIDSPDLVLSLDSASASTTDQEADISDLSGTSEGDVTPDLDAQNEYILDSCMLSLHERFAKTGYRVCPGHSDKNASSTTNKNRSSSSGNSQESRGRKRSSRQRDDRRQDESEPEHSDNGGRNQKRTRAARNDEARKFACPYHQNDPDKQRKSIGCSGPGWTDISRLKEHLYRVHEIPLFCRRCYETFDNQEELTSHSRSSQVCIVREPVHIEGFNEKQKKKLKDRKPMFSEPTESAKWNTVYLILFPDTALGDIPSPHYDDRSEDRSKQPAGDDPYRPPDVRQFEAFISRELPRNFRQTFETQMLHRLGPFEETLKNKCEELLRACFTKLASDYCKATFEAREKRPMHAKAAHNSENWLRTIPVLTSDPIFDLALPAINFDTPFEQWDCSMEDALLNTPDAGPSNTKNNGISNPEILNWNEFSEGNHNANDMQQDNWHCLDLGPGSADSSDDFLQVPSSCSPPKIALSTIVSKGRARTS